MNQFLKFSGLTIAKNSDGPRAPKNEPVHIYEDDQLEKFFAACNPFQKVIFNTLLKGGFRESEIVHACWSSLNLEKGYLRVEANPDYDFIPKTKTSRDVYLPPDVIEQLRTLKLTAKHKLIFPTKSGLPNYKLLRTCKRIAARAGLNPEEFWLHKFRSHFATVCLRKGMDIETLRSQMGHSKNSKSIWSYLMALQGKERSEKVAEIWAPIPQAQAVAAGVN
ncbi:MAG TPA: tyrosine-type recombinase/integrase [Candidatus Angelobacter sp.]